MKDIMNNRFSIDYVDPRPDYNYNETQLKIGTEIEREHCNFNQVAKMIAKDHLDINPEYYLHLVKMENSFKEEEKGESLPASLLTLSRLENPKNDTRLDKDYNIYELRKGIKVEMEHTDDPIMAKMIAKDHLDEYKNYYTKLEEFGITENGNTIEKSDVSVLDQVNYFNRVEFPDIFGLLNNNDIEKK